MAKVRRFRVESLEHAGAGDALILPPEELRHARVLRLEHDAAVELFDDEGRSVNAVLTGAGGELVARIISVAARPTTEAHVRLSIATAWPKGKRAAMLVEKCSELGLDCLIPIHYARSVVSKDDEAEGMARLRRIAAEAAKQSGRNDALQIAAEIPFAAALREYADALALIAEPKSASNLADILHTERGTLGAAGLILYIGPEGGFAAEELAEAERHGLRQVRLARHVLRIETAALAACSITRAMLD